MAGSERPELFGQLSGLPAAEFVIHREPMLLLDTLLAVGPEFAICQWCVARDNEFTVPGRGVPAYVGVEYMAQCVAVHAGANGRINGRPPQAGLLLGTRHYRANIRYFEVGTVYEVECRELVRNEDGMGAFDCRIMLNGTDIAEGRLAVLQIQKGNSK